VTNTGSTPPASPALAGPGWRPPEPPKRRLRDHLPFADHLLGIVGSLLAIAAVIAGALGVAVSNERSERNELQGAVESLERQVGDLKRSNEELSEENSDLRSRLDQEATTTSTTPRQTTSTTPATEGESVVRHASQQPVGLSSNYGLDLDSRVANWGVVNSPYDGEMDLYFNANGFWAEDRSLFAGSPHSNHDNEAQMAVMQGVPSKEGCRAATALTKELHNDLIVDGTQLCVVTSEGRVAGVTISSADLTGGQISLAITTWE